MHDLSSLSTCVRRSRPRGLLGKVAACFVSLASCIDFGGLGADGPPVRVDGGAGPEAGLGNDAAIGPSPREDAASAPGDATVSDDGAMAVDAVAPWREGGATLEGDASSPVVDAAAAACVPQYTTQNQACSDCSRSQCCSSMNAFFSDVDYTRFSTCLGGCGGTTTCVQSCKQQYPGIGAKFDAFFGCTQLSCSSACAQGGAVSADAGPAVDASTPDGGASDGGVSPVDQSCAQTNACAASEALGTIAGDTGAESVRSAGYTSKWFVVRVAETDSSVFSRLPVRARISLTYAAAAPFELYVYTAGSYDVSDRNCSSVSVVGRAGAQPNQTVALLQWDDTGGLGGGDDSRNVVVEVRNAGGVCDGSRGWSLVIDGNAP